MRTRTPPTVPHRSDVTDVTDVTDPDFPTHPMGPADLPGTPSLHPTARRWSGSARPRRKSWEVQPPR